MLEPIESYRKEAAARIQMATGKGGWEGTHTDFKQQLGTRSRDCMKLVKHMLAFANTPRKFDAFIIFGVAEDKPRQTFEHVGIPEGGFPPKETIEQIVHDYTTLENIFVDSHFVLDGKPTPYVVIPMQYDGPKCFTRSVGLGGESTNPGDIFCRYGSRSVRATPRDVIRMQKDWGSWFLDGRYEKTPSSLLSTLSKRFPRHTFLQDIGPCIRLVYASNVSNELGSNEFPSLIHAYWGFDSVEPCAVARIVEDNAGPVVLKTIVGARFAPNTLEVARSSGVNCVPLDEIYFVNDSYAKLCRLFLRHWDKERMDRHLSSIIDLDFRMSTTRSDTPPRHSVLAFLEDQLHQDGRPAVVVHGDFGCGKTTTAKRFVADLYEEYLRGNSTVPKVLYVNVNNIDIRARRDECIENELARYGITGDLAKDIVQSVARDEINLIFDAVDEMARPYTAAGRQDAVQLLQGVANRRAAVYFVRSSYFVELKEMIDTFSKLADVDFKTREKRTIIAQILGLRTEQVTEYLDSRLGPESGATVRSMLHKLGFQSFLSDPLIVSLVCSLVEEEGIETLDSFPREGHKARFLDNLVDKLLEREQEKRQRHGGLAEDFRVFQSVLQTVAFHMICQGTSHISNNQLSSFVDRALDSVTDRLPDAVDAFRTMSWIHRSSDGSLAFRHEALTLVCAAQHVNNMFEFRQSLGVADWQTNAPLAEVVCRYAGETIRSAAVLGAFQMLGGNLQFNVLQLINAIIEVASQRDDFKPVSEEHLEERTLAGIYRGIETSLSMARLPIRILMKSMGEKRSFQSYCSGSFQNIRIPRLSFRPP